MGDIPFWELSTGGPITREIASREALENRVKPKSKPRKLYVRKKKSPEDAQEYRPNKISCSDYGGYYGNNGFNTMGHRRVGAKREDG